MDLKMDKLIIFVSFLGVLTLIAGQLLPPEPEDFRIDDKQIDMFIKTYPEFFKHRRAEQKDFIQKLLRDDYEKQYKLVEMAIKHILKMLEVERESVSKIDHPEESLPRDPEDFKKVVTVLENSCLIAEFVLHFPKMSRKILEPHSNWRDLVEFGGSVLNTYRHVLDESTRKLISLFDQEINPEKRSDDFVNPYGKDPAEEETEVEEKPKKKKKKDKRGPALRGGDL